MGCLNANGSIQAYSDLLNSISDDELLGLVSVVNKELLTNPDRLKEVTVSLDQMDAAGVLDRTLKSAGSFLENADFLSSVLKAIQLGGQNPDIQDHPSIDPEILTTIAQLTKELDSGAGAIANTAKGFDVGISAVGLPSFQEIVTGLRPEIEDGPTLAQIVEQVHVYVQAKQDPKEPKLLSVLLEGIADRSIFYGLDHFYYDECEGARPGDCADRPRLSLDHQIASMEAFVAFLTRERRDVLQRLTKLFGVMNRPIRCLGDTKEIPNANLYTMDQLVSRDPLLVPSWVVRENMTKLKLASGMCDYPAEFDQLMGVLRELADPELAGRSRGGAARDEHMLVTVAHFVQGLRVGDEFGARSNLDRHRFRKFLINWLGDLSDVSPASHLANGLAELSRSDRRIIANLLYFLNAPDDMDRDTLANLISVLLKPRSELSGQSIYQVVSGVVTRLDSSTVYDVVKTLPHYIRSEQALLEPLLSANRDAFHMNDAHPFVNLVLAVGKNADTTYRPFFETLFAVAGRSQNELKNAFALTAKMAKNGSLKELLKGLLLPFRMTARQSAVNPNLRSIPPVRKRSNIDHRRSVAQAKAWDPTPPYWPWEHDAILACHQMNIENPLTPPLPNSPGYGPWASEINQYGACVDVGRNAGGQTAAMREFIEYGLNKKIGNQSAIGFIIDLAADFVRTDVQLKHVYDELSDLLINNKTFQDIVKFHETMVFALHSKYGPHAMSVVQGFLRTLPIVNQTNSTGQDRVQPLLNIAAKVIESPSAPGAAVLVYDLLDEAEKRPAPTIAPKVIPRSFPVNLNNEIVVARAIELLNQVEKTKTDTERQRRLNEMFNEYLGYVKSDERRWEYRNATEFKSSLKPLLDEIAKGSRIEWILAFMHYLESDPYDPKWWEGWFHRLSSRVFPIAYQYPGEAKRVRLVNYLDLLELIVTDANFTLKEVGQTLSFLDGLILKESDVSAVRHLSKLGRYQDGQDMTPWVNELHTEIEIFNSVPVIPILGDPLKPEVRRRLFNLENVAFVVKHLNQSEETITAPDGRRLVRNDLGVLRDLFKMLNSSMPVDQRLNYNREHALSVVTSLTEFGLLRMIGRNIWVYDENGRKIAVGLNSILKTLRDVAVQKTAVGRETNKDTLALLDHLLRKDVKPGVDPARATFDERYMFIGKFIDQYFAWVQNDQCSAPPAHAAFKCSTAAIKSATYGLASFSADANNPLDLSKVLRAVISNQYTTFLGRNLDVLEDLIATPKAAGFFSGLERAADNENNRAQAYSDLLNITRTSLKDMALSNAINTHHAVSIVKDLKEDAQNRWDKAVATLDSMKADPAYQRHREEVLEPIMKSVVHWLPEKTALRPRLQTYLANHLRNGKTREIVRFGAQECVDDRSYSKIKFIGEPTYVSGYQDFLEDLRAGLQDIH